ncbi:hypothetical protein [Sulfitobacter marinus]|uniref:hypothetical protein n=1 Tax=Sulfitobacter marinus TaxID=394264 RepID=UPI001FE48B32|nr:hypothetical protein [Sulfitobacter marinus]
MAESYNYGRRGRNSLGISVLILLWAALLYAWVSLDAAPLIIGVIGICSLPALYDVVANPAAGLSLSPTSLTWHSGNRTAEISLPEISHIRLDTRLDFSTRATVILNTGRKLRIPYEATPPHKAFEQALNARNLKTERHHFSLKQ